jgi:hypothetical protein
MSDTALQGPQPAAPGADPLVNLWFSRVKASEKRWDNLHKRMRYSRKLVRGIDDNADPRSAAYNKDRANLIQSTLVVVLSKVYAQNPEMAATPTNKARDLELFAETVSEVTQVSLVSAKLKARAKACVRAAMTCAYGVAKVQYQRVKAGEQPIIRNRINDTQQQIERLHSLAKDVKDDKGRADVESKMAELQQVMQGLKSQSEVVAAEGLVIDKVASDLWLIDEAIADFGDYEQARWMAEKIPLPRSTVQGMYPDMDLSTATTYKPDGGGGKDPTYKRQPWSGAQVTAGEDPILMVVEVWSKMDNRLFTLVEGCNKQFARPAFTPQGLGERWWPYFVLPFQSVDGEFTGQSLVDVMERLVAEHNETRDKFAELRRQIKPHYHASADLKDESIVRKTMAELGEVVVIDTGGEPLQNVFQEAPQLKIDPLVFDTGPIRADIEMVSGLQDAARSTVIQPKTATEAAISNESLSARVAEFRDQVEDWLTEIAQYASEVCLLNVPESQVQTIMGMPEPVDPQAVAQAQAMGQPAPTADPTYSWPPNPTPETVFNLVEISIRAGSTAAPNKLQAQQNWTQALSIIGPMIDKIRMLDSTGQDSTPERELLRETASRFDETIDVDRYLPPKPAPVSAALPSPVQLAMAMGGGAPGAAPGGPMPGGAPGGPMPALPAPVRLPMTAPAMPGHPGAGAPGAALPGIRPQPTTP